MKLDLSKTILILFEFSQLFTLSNSASKMRDISDRVLFLNEQVRVLSSANKVKRKKSDELRKSLMKIKDKSGPSTEPWEPPCVIEQSSEFTSFIDTHCSRLNKYDLSHSNALPRISCKLTLFSRIPWSILSNALLKSRKIYITDHPLFN